MAINLTDYEDVASLNKWFQGNFPMGSLRILKQEHHIMTDKDGHIIDEIFVALHTRCLFSLGDSKVTSYSYPVASLSERGKRHSKALKLVRTCFI